MNPDTIGLITGVSLIILVFTGGFFSGEQSNEQLNQKLAIENGCGQYNPQSGKFEWLKVNK